MFISMFCEFNNIRHFAFNNNDNYYHYYNKIFLVNKKLVFLKKETNVSKTKSHYHYDNDSHNNKHLEI